MSEEFLPQLCAAVCEKDVIRSQEQRVLIGRAIADTLAVAAAGFHEPVARSALAAYDGGPARTFSGEACESEEAAVLVNAIAAHALDFDDIYLESLTHISAVLLPTVLRGPEPDPQVVYDAFAAGLIAARAVARRVGSDHYHKGWHGTGTIGAFGAAAAAGRMLGLSEQRMADAFALVAGMSGGLKVNFSTRAKPAQAGFAAVAGVRAARLAAAGVSGSRDVFSARGYGGLYGGADAEARPGPDAFALRPDRISVKLYPCCYAAHRLVGIALDARGEIGIAMAEADSRYRLEVPAGSLEALVRHRPRTGLEAKFSPAYCFAAAVMGGQPILADFDDEAVDRPEIVAAMERLEIVEDPLQAAGQDIASGEVRLSVDMPTGARRFVRTTLPGSPLDPPSEAALKSKLRACLARFEERAGHPFPISAPAKRLGIAGWFDHDPSSPRPLLQDVVGT